MRIPALVILTIATVAAASSARAQTYDPNYPVCLQVYQGYVDYYFECTAGTVLHVGIGPLRAVCGQPVLRRSKKTAGATRPAVSPCPLN